MLLSLAIAHLLFISDWLVPYFAVREAVYIGEPKIIITVNKECHVAVIVVDNV